ncbi:hypothetical protein [Megalodesulfovibrio paquesii]
MDAKLFKNNDAVLLARVEQALEARRKAGLEGLVGGLEGVWIAVEPETFGPAVEELLRVTGLEFREAFEDDASKTCHLGQDGNVDFLIRVRKGGANPFRTLNDNPKTRHLPNTRLETFVYKCRDLERFVALQREQGRQFLTADIQRTPQYSFIQTPPSPFTGNSLGFIQWHGTEGAWRTEASRPLDWRMTKPDHPWLANIFELDHTATRVKAEERDEAIIEFLEWTNYRFAFAVYVESLNSITNVARLSMDDYAQVFTSGIKPFESLEASGPTERFIYNYGKRVHHLAFRTEEIEFTYEKLGDAGLQYMVELVGSREEGLKQTFTYPSQYTFLVNEYIHRYDGFDGFFTKSNVTALTKATEKQ